MRASSWLLLLILLVAGPASAQPLRLAASPWPPYTDQRLPGNGLAVELVTTALRRAGYEVEYVEVPWSRVMHGLVRGDYDLTSAWYSPKRLGFAAFSRPYLNNRLRWVVRRGSAIDYDGLHSLHPYRIGLSRGYAYSPELEQDAALERVEVADFVSAARMLSAGRIDLTLEDEQVVRHHLRNELRLVREAYEMLPTPYSENGLSLLVRRGHPRCDEIVQAFDREIARMQADGSYRAIFNQFGVPVP
ncbi:amino acid ABC transporter substrate-binding protein [Stutzerimonas nosocomialis]|uniref:substrate-binding periplasmic protein n=1 Tax=Stutzerimonas nosocomialis TaxID=1056496 RepID=UPI001108C384|nr:transporter substrate-binding domain-containing protein [Stutzerimonas nosocomialis]TLX60764.1 amino acid ABC transporter substrate-binding protein [Stutzerimonas nosocomialis]